MAEALGCHMKVILLGLILLANPLLAKTFEPVSWSRMDRVCDFDSGRCILGCNTQPLIIGNQTREIGIELSRLPHGFVLDPTSLELRLALPNSSDFVILKIETTPACTNCLPFQGEGWVKFRAYVPRNLGRGSYQLTVHKKEETADEEPLWTIFPEQARLLLR